MEASTPNAAVSGDRAFKEAIKVKRGHRDGDLIQCDWCPYKKRERLQGCVGTEERPCKDTMRGQLSASQGARP